MDPILMTEEQLRAEIESLLSIKGWGPRWFELQAEVQRRETIKTTARVGTWNSDSHY